MSNITRGFVRRLFKKEGTSKRGPWVADSFKLEDEAGNEDPFFYQVGCRKDVGEAPGITRAEGKFVEIEYEDKDASARTFISGKILGEQPERAASTPPAEGGVPASRGSGGASTQSNIHYQNSRTAAYEVVSTLLDNDALPMSGAKTKAGQAKRYDEIIAMIDTLTVKYFQDLETFRLFETVTDVGVVDTSPDGELPEDDVPEVPDDSGDEEL